MGRFYSITVEPGPSGQARQWTSYNVARGQDDPGALNVQFDFLEYDYGVPMGNSTITIEGVALEDLQHAQNFAGRQVSVLAGMSAGLPLANPAQAGLILQGQIYQSFGNWVGTDMTLDFVVVPSRYTFDAPGNFVLNWQKGTDLQAALQNTLAVAYPGVKVTFALGQQYVASSTIPHYCHTLYQLSSVVQSVTKSPTSPGVHIAYLNTGGLLVTDFQVVASTVNLVQVQFVDLVGQPTWINQNQFQFQTVMRSDIQVGTYIQMPQGFQDAPGFVQTAAASLPSQLKYKTSFQGVFLVQSVRQIGNFRDPNGASWVTVYQCAVQTGV